MFTKSVILSESYPKRTTATDPTKTAEEMPQSERTLRRPPNPAPNRTTGPEYLHDHRTSGPQNLSDQQYVHGVQRAIHITSKTRHASPGTSPRSPPTNPYQKQNSRSDQVEHDRSAEGETLRLSLRGGDEETEQQSFLPVPQTGEVVWEHQSCYQEVGRR